MMKTLWVWALGALVAWGCTYIYYRKARRDWAGTQKLITSYLQFLEKDGSLSLVRSKGGAVQRVKQQHTNGAMSGELGGFSSSLGGTGKA